MANTKKSGGKSCKQYMPIKSRGSKKGGGKKKGY